MGMDGRWWCSARIWMRIGGHSDGRTKDDILLLSTLPTAIDLRSGTKIHRGGGRNARHTETSYHFHAPRVWRRPRPRSSGAELSYSPLVLGHSCHRRDPTERNGIVRFCQLVDVCRMTVCVRHCGSAGKGVNWDTCDVLGCGLVVEVGSANWVPSRWEMVALIEREGMERD